MLEKSESAAEKNTEKILTLKTLKSEFTRLKTSEMSCSFICTKRVLLIPCFMESARICGAGFRFPVLQVCREMK